MPYYLQGPKAAAAQKRVVEWFIGGRQKRNVDLDVSAMRVRLQIKDDKIAMKLICTLSVKLIDPFAHEQVVVTAPMLLPSGS